MDSVFGKAVTSERVQLQDRCGTRAPGLKHNRAGIGDAVLAMFWERLRTPCRVGRDSSNHALQIV